MERGKEMREEKNRKECRKEEEKENVGRKWKKEEERKITNERAIGKDN